MEGNLIIVFFVSGEKSAVLDEFVMAQDRTNFDTSLFFGDRHQDKKMNPLVWTWGGVLGWAVYFVLRNQNEFIRLTALG